MITLSYMMDIVQLRVKKKRKIKKSLRLIKRIKGIKKIVSW